MLAFSILMFFCAESITYTDNPDWDGWWYWDRADHVAETGHGQGGNQKDWLGFYYEERDCTICTGIARYHLHVHDDSQTNCKVFQQWGYGPPISWKTGLHYDPNRMVDPQNLHYTTDTIWFPYEIQDGKTMPLFIWVQPHCHDAAFIDFMELHDASNQRLYWGKRGGGVYCLSHDRSDTSVDGLRTCYNAFKFTAYGGDMKAYRYTGDWTSKFCSSKCGPGDKWGNDGVCNDGRSIYPEDRKCGEGNDCYDCGVRDVGFGRRRLTAVEKRVIDAEIEAVRCEREEEDFENCKDAEEELIQAMMEDEQHWEEVDDVIGHEEIPIKNVKKKKKLKTEARVGKKVNVLADAPSTQAFDKLSKTHSFIMLSLAVVGLFAMLLLSYKAFNFCCFKDYDVIKEPVEQEI